jgi:hypothetical protein
VRNLGVHGGVLATETQHNAVIQGLVYANLAMPGPHLDAATHMHQILQLQRWVDRKCVPTPVPSDT